MGLALFKEKRLSDRRRLTGVLPGKLTLDDPRGELSMRLVDVSQHGIGIVLNRQLPVGFELDLVMKDGAVHLKVAWGQPDFGKQDMFRYGLVTVDHDVDLEQLFFAAGCLK